PTQDRRCGASVPDGECGGERRDVRWLAAPARLGAAASGVGDRGGDRRERWVARPAGGGDEGDDRPGAGPDPARPPRGAARAGADGGADEPGRVVYDGVPCDVPGAGARAWSDAAALPAGEGGRAPRAQPGGRGSPELRGG